MWCNSISLTLKSGYAVHTRSHIITRFGAQQATWPARRSQHRAPSNNNCREKCTYNLRGGHTHMRSTAADTASTYHYNPPFDSFIHCLVCRKFGLTARHASATRSDSPPDRPFELHSQTVSDIHSRSLCGDTTPTVCLAVCSFCIIVCVLSKFTSREYRCRGSSVFRTLF